MRSDIRWIKISRCEVIRGRDVFQAGRHRRRLRMMRLAGDRQGTLYKWHGASHELHYTPAVMVDRTASFHSSRAAAAMTARSWLDEA